MMIAPVKITATDDSGPIHRAQIEVNGTPETLDDVAVMQFYGFAAHCPVNSDATAFFVSGQRSNAVVVGTNNQKSRLRGLEPGEVALYDDGKNRITLKRGNTIEIRLRKANHQDRQNRNRGRRDHHQGQYRARARDLNATGAINAPRGSVGGGRE